MIQIDQNKCIRCMKCVAVCPFFVLGNVDSKPCVIRENLCIKCLHCAAACPEKAISLENYDGILDQEKPQIPNNFNQLLEGHLLTRRSYRHFKNQPVSKDMLEHAITVSAWAPSAKNQHPTKWVVVQDEQTLDKMMDLILSYVKESGISPEIASLYSQGCNVVMGTAKTLLIAYAKTTAINPLVDSALAMYNVELLLQTKGVGTCWAGYLMRMCNQIPEMKELLSIPEGYQVYNAMMLGYPEGEEYLHIPNRHKKPKINWV